MGNHRRLDYAGFLKAIFFLKCWPTKNLPFLGHIFCFFPSMTPVLTWILRIKKSFTHSGQRNHDANTWLPNTPLWIHCIFFSPLVSICLSVFLLPPLIATV